MHKSMQEIVEDLKKLQVQTMEFRPIPLDAVADIKQAMDLDDKQRKCHAAWSFV
jgi:hypothetical protein